MGCFKTLNVTVIGAVVASEINQLKDTLRNYCRYPSVALLDNSLCISVEASMSCGAATELDEVIRTFCRRHACLEIKVNSTFDDEDVSFVVPSFMEQSKTLRLPVGWTVRKGQGLNPWQVFDDEGQLTRYAGCTKKQALYNALPDVGVSKTA